MERSAPTTTWIRAAVIAAGALVLTGCSAAERPEVEHVALIFEDSAADPQTRCALLAPKTLAALEQEAPCTDAIEQLPLQGGEVTGVEIWGGEAQVRLRGDTVFLTETGAGWRVVAAACQPQGDAPYDCEVEGP